MKKLVFTCALSLVLSSGCLNSSKSSSDSAADQSDNSVHGVTSCTDTCEPVDIANCNDTSTDSPIVTCFLHSRMCSGPSDEINGPDLVVNAPSGCILVSPLPAGASGETTGTVASVSPSTTIQQSF